MSVGISPSLPRDLFLVFVARVDLDPRVSLGYVFCCGAWKEGRDHKAERTVMRGSLSPSHLGTCSWAAKPGPWGAEFTEARAQGGCYCLTESLSARPRVRA